jgi:hypothetical protein
VTTLRTLNAHGIRHFQDYLRSIRAGSEFQANPALLYVDEFSTVVSPRIDVDASRVFRSKMELAGYLAEVLRPIDTPSLSGDAGLWSWLALFYFDQLSPVGADGKRRPREDYHYVPGRGQWRSERHLLAGPYQVYRHHGENARVLLSPRVNQHGSFIYDLGSRRDFLLNRGLIEAVDILYWNPRTKRPKVGATSTRPGNLRRLIAVLQQFEFNYDLFGMSAQEILALLPKEFEGWRPARVSASKS